MNLGFNAAPTTAADPRAVVSTSSAAPHYVIASEHGYSCFGYDNARDHAFQIAALLQRPELALTDAEYGQVAGYEKYRAAVSAWSCSPLSKQTYFDPRTPAVVRKILERYRASGDSLRVFLGDPATGCDWLEENDVVGRVGRSMGPMRVPLLVQEGERGGSALLTAYVIRLIDWESQKEVYRHPAYQAPAIELKDGTEPDLPFEVWINGSVQARFEEIGAAGAYMAFMGGFSVPPVCFQ